MSRLGVSKDGYEIVARGCAEDNSGTIVYLEQLGIYQLRMSQPVDIAEDDTPIYTLNIANKEIAIDTFREYLGSFGEGI